MKIVVALSCLFLITACNSEHSLPEPIEPPDIPRPINYTKLLCPEIAGGSAVEERAQFVIQDESNYLHQIEASDLFFEREIPSVDFSTETVLAVNMGFQPSLGYEIDIIEISESNTFLGVVIEETVPICGASDAISYPYCIVSIPKTNKEVQFLTETVEECD